MGMFKWLKRELRSSGRERSKSEIAFEQVGSPKSNRDDNVTEETRDEDYLRKLSKFNEWRSSHASIRHGQMLEEKHEGERRKSQADFRSVSDTRNDVRYSLDNHHIQYKHLEKNGIHSNTPPKSRNTENIYITDRSQTEPKSRYQNNYKENNATPKNKREIARIDMTFNQKSTQNEIHSIRNEQKKCNQKSYDSPKKWLLENGASEYIQNSFNESQHRPESPPDSFYHENSLPYTKNDDTYQWVINKHGEYVEYALPYNERSIDIGKRDLSDILENDSASESTNESEKQISESSTFSITNSMNFVNSGDVENQCGNVRHESPVDKEQYIVDSDTYKINRKLSYDTNSALVTRFGTNVPNDKVAKRLSEVDVKSVNVSGKRPNLQEVIHSDDNEDESHNQEFLDAIEDLVNLGRWSRQQLETDEPMSLPKHSGDTAVECDPIYKQPNDTEPVKLKTLQPINPFSSSLSCPVIHISALSISEEALTSCDTVLVWKNAEWLDQTVCIRRPKPGLVHLNRTQTAMARDIHILRNVPHPNIALLMAVAYDDNNQVITVMEPFTISLYQLLHEQPLEIPVQLDLCVEYIQHICSAISFLHARGYIHSNISSHCILVNHNLNLAKLAGFDLAVSIDKDHKKYFSRRNNSQNVPTPEKSLNSESVDDGEIPESGFFRTHCSNQEIRKKFKVKTPRSYNIWDTCRWGEEQLVSDRDVLGNFQWQAPELFWEEDSKVRPCVSSDVYSLSVVLWECCTVTIPWEGVNCEDLANKYDNEITIDIPDTVENVYKEAIIKGLELNPKLRNFTPSDLMFILKNIKPNNTSDTFVWKNKKYGSHSRLGSIISKCYAEENSLKNPTLENPLNIIEDSNKTNMQEIHEDYTARSEQLLSEINRNRLEFTIEDTKRMTASDFIRQLEIETSNLSRILKNSTNINKTPEPKINFSNISHDNSTPCNIFTSPLNATNSTEYYSLAEKSSSMLKKSSFRSKEKHTLNDTTLSPIVDPSQSSKLLLNITPKFYTPLQIESPVSINKESKDISLTNSENAKSHDSIYSFNIEDYELPETPIARNTKIRKNAWLSEQKHKSETDHLKRKRFSLSFNNVKSNKEMIVNEGSPVLANNLHLRESTPKDNNATREEDPSTPNQCDNKMRYNSRINNVKTKLNDILSRSLSCGTNCISSTPTRVTPLSYSYTQERNFSNKENSLSSPVKPASHSIETKFVFMKQKESVSSRTLSPPYRPEAIKPASHQDEHLLVSNNVMESADKTSAPALTKESIRNLKSNSSEYFEKSLWRLEKSKCKIKEDVKICNSRNTNINEEGDTNENYSKTSEIQKYIIPVHYSTLPNKITPGIIVRPKSKFLTHVSKDKVLSNKLTVMEIAKLFEKRDGTNLNNHDRELNVINLNSCLPKNNEMINIDTINVNVNVDIHPVNFENRDEILNVNSTNILDESFIYNNALDESEETEVNVCTHCGSNMSGDKKSETRRLTLGPEIAEMCANILRSSTESLWQIPDIDSRYLLGAFELAQTPLKRCQAFPAIQNARSTEDLYIDDEFSAEHLGSHMQLSESRNDIFYVQSDLYPINLEENPLSINLDGVNEEPNDDESPKEQYEPMLTGIEEETEPESSS